MTREAYGSQVVESVELRGQSTVDAEELLVHDGGEREITEGLHASVVDCFRVLVLACVS